MITPLHALKRLVSRVLIGVLLSTQIAVAGYACPIQAAHHSSVSSGAASESAQEAASRRAEDRSGSIDLAREMPGGAGAVPDPALPNLCLVHCQSGQQSADHKTPPALAPPQLEALYPLPPLHRSSDASVLAASARGSGTQPAAEPSHAILHCCLRH